MNINLQVKQAQILDDLAQEVNDIAQEKGFWGEDNLWIIPTKLSLIHDEVSEALEVYREEYDGIDSNVSYMTPRQEDDFCEELADIIIRTLDLAGQFDLDIGYAITDKIARNKERPRKHGKRF